MDMVISCSRGELAPKVDRRVVELEYPICMIRYGPFAPPPRTPHLRRLSATVSLDPDSATPIYGKLSDWFRRAIHRSPSEPRGSGCPSLGSRGELANIPALPVLDGLGATGAGRTHRTLKAAGTLRGPRSISAADIED